MANIYSSQPLLEHFRREGKVSTITKKDPDRIREIIDDTHNKWERDSRRAWLREKVRLAYGDERAKHPLMDSALRLKGELFDMTSGMPMSQLANDWAGQLIEQYPQLAGQEITLDSFREHLNRWIEGHRES